MDTEFDSKKILLVLGTNIRKIREMRGLNLQELASMINYDRGCLASLEYGEQNVEYETIIKLARQLNVSFPALFSRTFLHATPITSNTSIDSYIEDNYLLVFIENFNREMKRQQLKQIEVYSATDVQTSVISRIINGKSTNPTINTLYAMAYTLNTEMESLFSRNKLKKEDSK